MKQKPNIAFFGTPDIAVWVLEELERADLTPTCIVTNPDRPQGRGLELTSTPVKKWAQAHNIPVFTPENLTNKESLTLLTEQTWDVFVVVAYGLIMPKWFIELPKFGTVNMHPSLLPKLRGASPIRTAILEGLKHMGVTIMLMDEKMDHGPILDQLPLDQSFPIPGRKLDYTLAKMGGNLLADVLPRLCNGEIVPREQNHAEATYSKKITKEMGALTLDPFNLPHGQEAYTTYLKICAYDEWPGTFFFHKEKRIKITDAFLQSGPEGALEIYKVIPEGKKEMAFTDFLKSIS